MVINKSKLNKIKRKNFKLIIIVGLILISFFARSLIIIVHNMPNGELIKINKFFDLKNKPLDRKDPLILKEKQGLLDFLSKYSGHNVTNVDTLFYLSKNRFGNQVIIISKLIFYCEILGCKRIILDKKINWFIKNKIIYQKYNMTIETGYKIKYENSRTVFDHSINWLYYFYLIKPEIRSDIIKNEIIKNLPKVEVNQNELFIHIRSGDIFENRGCKNRFYSQPPLCFYETIISSHNYKNIYIISENKNNPIIDKLIRLFPNIIYNQNKLKVDIAYLIYASKIVGSFSTFINILIRLNDNLKYFWEYNLSSILSKIIHCYHSYFRPFKNITYYIMEPSKNYIQNMKYWNCSKVQLELMIAEKCNNNFIVLNK